MPHPIGSAVVLRVGDVHFALTAYHVLEHFISRDEAPVLGAHPFNIPPAGPIMNLRMSAEDTRDAAVFEIAPERVTDDLRSAAITPDQVETRSVQGGQFLTILGFPASRYGSLNGRSIARPLTSWTGMTLSAAELTALGHNSDYHTAIHFIREGAQDELGAPRTGPNMNGASGCGMWQMPPFGHTTIDGQHGKLVSLFTDFTPPKSPTIMLGTSISAHVQIILEMRPDLVPEFGG